MDQNLVTRKTSNSSDSLYAYFHEVLGLRNWMKDKLDFNITSVRSPVKVHVPIADEVAVETNSSKQVGDFAEKAIRYFDVLVVADFTFEENKLWIKMMQAIGEPRFSLLSPSQLSQQDDISYRFAVCFSEDKTTLSSLESPYFVLPEMNRLLSGSPDQIKKNKMKAWNLLKELSKSLKSTSH